MILLALAVYWPGIYNSIGLGLEMEKDLGLWAFLEYDVIKE